MSMEPLGAGNEPQLQSLDDLIFPKATNGIWVCFRCNQDNLVTCFTCVCGYANVSLVSSETNLHESQALGRADKFSCWTCTKCTFEQNRVDFEICLKCQTPNPRLAANIEAPKPVVEMNTGDVVFQGPCWTCPKCSYGYNMREVVKCERCPFTRSRVAKQKDENPSKLPAFALRNPWSCQCGNSGIKANSCNLCGRTEMQQVIAPPPHQLVQERHSAYSEWRCSNCGFAKNTSLQCTSCSMPKGYVCQPSNPQNMWQCVCTCLNQQGTDVCVQCRRIKQIMPKEVSVTDLKLLMGAHGWICRSCFRENSIDTNKCQHCSQLNGFATFIHHFLA